MNIVAVTFDDGSNYTGRSPQSKCYHYKTDIEFEVGDQAIVDSPYGTKIVTIRSLNPVGGIRNATKWIISKVDRGRFLARQQAEAELADLRIEFDKMLEKVVIRDRRERLVGRYPELGSILTQIEGLEATLGIFAN